MKNSVEVDIHGQSFRLRTEADERYVRELAGYVDGVMRRVSQGPSVLAKDRVAIMAALQITDSFFQLKQRTDDDHSTVVERLSRLVEECDQLLDE